MNESMTADLPQVSQEVVEHGGTLEVMLLSRSVEAEPTPRFSVVALQDTMGIQ